MTIEILCVPGSNSYHVSSQAPVPNESLKHKSPKLSPTFSFPQVGFERRSNKCYINALPLNSISPIIPSLWCSPFFFVCNHVASRLSTFIIAVDLRRNNLWQKDFFWEDLSHFGRCDLSWWGRHGDSNR